MHWKKGVGLKIAVGHLQKCGWEKQMWWCRQIKTIDRYSLDSISDLAMSQMWNCTNLVVAKFEYHITDMTVKRWSSFTKSQFWMAVSLGMMLQMQINFCHPAEITISFTKNGELHVNASHKCFYSWSCKSFIFITD